MLAELLPPLEPDGTSHLWEAVGRRFIGMSYAEADKLSKKNKEFIKALFPEGVIYASVLAPDAQAVIGKVGAQTRGVEKLLRRIGFRYAHRVDPFDGGPHFTARMDQISLVAATKSGLAGRPLPPADQDPASPKPRRALVAVELAEAPYFRAVLADVRDEGGRGFAVDAAAWDVLGLREGAPVTVLPIE